MIVILHSYQGFDLVDLRGVLSLGAGVNFFFVLSGWAAAGLKDTLLRCEVKPEVVHGNEKAVQPRVQA